MGFIEEWQEKLGVKIVCSQVGHACAGSTPGQRPAHSALWTWAAPHRRAMPLHTRHQPGVVAGVSSSERTSQHTQQLLLGSSATAPASSQAGTLLITQRC